MIRVVRPGSGTDFLPIPDAGSGSQKGIGSRIRNTERKTVNQEDTKENFKTVNQEDTKENFTMTPYFLRTGMLFTPNFS
jgi:hypothetical protein